MLNHIAMFILIVITLSGAAIINIYLAKPKKKNIPQPQYVNPFRSYVVLDSDPKVINFYPDVDITPEHFEPRIKEQRRLTFNQWRENNQHLFGNGVLPNGGAPKLLAQRHSFFQILASRGKYAK